MKTDGETNNGQQNTMYIKLKKINQHKHHREIIGAPEYQAVPSQLVLNDRSVTSEIVLGTHRNGW